MGWDAWFSVIRVLAGCYFDPMMPFDATHLDLHVATKCSNHSCCRRKSSRTTPCNRYIDQLHVCPACVQLVTLFRFAQAQLRSAMFALFCNSGGAATVPSTRLPDARRQKKKDWCRNENDGPGPANLGRHMRPMDVTFSLRITHRGRPHLHHAWHQMKAIWYRFASQC